MKMAFVFPIPPSRTPRSRRGIQGILPKARPRITASLPAGQSPKICASPS